MKRTLWLALFLPVLAQAQLYDKRIEAGDTLFSNTPDTTDENMLYNGSTDERRIIRPTLHIDLDEIGTNTTHYWIQVDTRIAPSNIDIATDGWSIVHSDFVQDFAGIAATAQNNISIPMPFLEQYAFYYVSFIISYPYGAAADSTAWSAYLEGDETGNMYQPPLTNMKRITHYNMWGSRAAQLAKGGVNTATYQMDFRIETVPGVFQMPDRAYLTTVGDGAQYDDDSLTVFVQAVARGITKSGYIDTLTMNISSGASDVAAFSFTVPTYASGSAISSTGFVDAVRLIFTTEGGDSNDSTNFFSDIVLECDP